MTPELIAIFGVLAVVAVTSTAPKLGVAPPLILVALGVGWALLPFVEVPTISSEIILAGVLPPLLYSQAVNTSTIEFRRDFRLISTFSVTLVLITSVAVGFLVSTLVPAIPLGLGIALGAIVSPTDAVATSIVRKAGVSTRVVTVLEGESMLNDATALVLLRSAVAATGVAISWWQVAVDLVWAVVVAAGIGYAVGRVVLLARSKVDYPPASVALSLVVPYLAYLPTEHLGGSGLVAAVTAGLVTGVGAQRRLRAQDRLTERSVWQTIELLLESGIFLGVGLELPQLITELTSGDRLLAGATLLAVATATTVIAVRAVFVSWSVWTLGLRNRRSDTVRGQINQLQDQLAEDGRITTDELLPRGARRTVRRYLRRNPDAGPEAKRSRFEQFLTRRLADLDYLAASRFGWRDGVILVSAGMRGAVTVAAAQSLPEGTPHRSLLVLVAIMVAVGTLVVQGATLPWLARRLDLAEPGSTTAAEQWNALHDEVSAAVRARLLDAEAPAGVDLKTARALADRLLLQYRNGPDETMRTTIPTPASLGALHRLVLDWQREELLAIRSLGTYPTGMLEAALTQLDAEQLGIELRDSH